MKILMLAPHPMIENRGSPIAVDLLLKVLSQRGDRVDVVTYHLGKDIYYEGVTLHRIRPIWFIRSVRPGFSWKKLVCDAMMFLKAFGLARRNRYDVVHAVEEAVYIAMAIRLFYSMPYVYDMDSSLAQQMVEKYRLLRPFQAILRLFERSAIRRAMAVVPVCDALKAVAERAGARNVLVLQDIPLLQDGVAPPGAMPVRETLGIKDALMMYVGNLEPYQGIALMLRSFALQPAKTTGAHLVIAGGVAGDIEKYGELARSLGIRPRVHFLGPQPVEYLGWYLSQADILISPRLTGNNTPMKLFSYLASGKPVLATDLATHTQVLTPEVAMLCPATPEAFGAGMTRLVEHPNLRSELGNAGKRFVETNFSFELFKEKVHRLYDGILKEQHDEKRSETARG